MYAQTCIGSANMLFIIAVVFLASAGKQAMVEGNAGVLKNYKGLIVTSKKGSVVNETNSGLLLPKEEFVEEPQFKMADADPSGFYTLVMVDPDAPNHADGEFFLHMLDVNIKGSKLRAGASLGGTELLAYRKPTPPKGTGTHRYISLVYRQPGDGFKPDFPSARAKFNLDRWLDGKNLSGPQASVDFTSKF